MDTTYFLGGLALLTLLAVVGFAITSKRKVDAQRKDEDQDPSSLAKDG